MQLFFYSRLISLFLLIFSIQMTSADVFETNLNHSDKIENKSNDADQCRTELKKLGIGLLKVGLFYAQVFVTHYTLKDLYPYLTGNPKSFEFRDVLTFYLVLELALNSQHFYSFFNDHHAKAQIRCNGSCLQASNSEIALN